MPNPNLIDPTANQQLAITANQALDKVVQYLESVESFAVEQAPLLVQEVLRFEILTRGFWLFFGIALLVWCFIGLRWSFRKAEQRIKRSNEHTNSLREHQKSGYNTQDLIFEFCHYAIPVSGGAAGFVGLIMACSSIEPFIKVLIAPRLFLLEYFRALVG